MRFVDGLLALTLASGAHFGAFALMPPRPISEPAGAAASASIEAANAELTAMVQKWTKAPDHIERLRAPYSPSPSLDLPETFQVAAAPPPARPAQPVPLRKETAPTASTSDLAPTDVAPNVIPLTLPATSPLGLAIPNLEDLDPSVRTSGQLAPPEPASAAPSVPRQQLNRPTTLDAPKMGKPVQTHTVPQLNIVQSSEPKRRAVSELPGQTPETAPFAQSAPDRLDARNVSLRPVTRPARFANIAQQRKPKPTSAKPSSRKSSASAKRSGNTQRAKVPTSSATNLSALKNAWAAQITRKTYRNIVQPGGARAAKPARLKIKIARDGRLRSVSLAASSGNAKVDKAAIGAVRRSRRFPPAPKGLNKAVYEFRLAIRVTP